MEPHAAIGVLRDVIALHSNPAHRLPRDVQIRARWLFLDTLGCAVAGGRSPTVRAWLREHGLRNDPYGTSTATTLRASFGPAVALAMGACWDEACEGHAGAHGRPGVAALSALWPYIVELDWDRLLRALVLGYEVGARMGALLRIGPGLHVDANWPSLGAAAAAAVAMGLDSDRILTAVNIAACQLPLSLYRPIETGDTARNTYLGHAAMLGQFAAQSAAAGISAPHDAIAGCLRVTAAGPARDAALAGPETFEIMSAYFKRFAAVRHVHYGAQAALVLRPGIRPEHIAAIDLWTYAEALTYCGIRQPSTPLQAQFSLSFGVAAMLRWGHLDPQVYRSPFFEDPLLKDLEQKIVIHVDPAQQSPSGRWARLRLSLTDGETLEETATAVHGDASLPWSEEELTTKFLTLCNGSLDRERAQNLAAHILQAPLQAPVFGEPH